MIWFSEKIQIPHRESNPEPPLSIAVFGAVNYGVLCATLVLGGSGFTTNIVSNFIS